MLITSSKYMQADNNTQTENSTCKEQKYRTIKHKLDINEDVLVSNIKVTSDNNECQTHEVHILTLAKTQHNEECSMRQQREQYTWSTVPSFSSKELMMLSSNNTGSKSAQLDNRHSVVSSSSCPTIFPMIDSIRD
jgi:hypothetical protein